MKKVEIYVFGRGMYYKLKRDGIVSNYSIVGFLDNLMELDKVDYEQGIPVYNPSYITGQESASVAIAATDFVSIFYQLKELGVEDKKILLLQNLYPSFDDFERLIMEHKLSIDIHDNHLFLTDSGEKFVILNNEDFKNKVRKTLTKQSRDIEFINQLSLRPLSSRFGAERGTPVDRVYIEKFLKQNQQFVKGEVLEVADNKYTLKFGKPNCHSHVMHVLGWKGAEKVNLETGEGIIENSIDCFICTQVLQMIYNLDSAVANIYKLLKKDGRALITVSGISQISLNDYSHWGEYWRLTSMTCEKLFLKFFDKDKIHITTYGNVKMACAFMYGVCSEDLPETDFEYIDEQFPVLIGIHVQK